MCVCCHYKGDNCLVTAKHKAKAHADRDARCIRTRPGGRQQCVDCGKVLDSADIRVIRGVWRYDHVCAEVMADQRFGPGGIYASPRRQCQARMVRTQTRPQCRYQARFIVRNEYDDELLVCGYHARGWVPQVIRRLGKATEGEQA